MAKKKRFQLLTFPCRTLSLSVSLSHTHTSLNLEPRARQTNKTRYPWQIKIVFSLAFPCRSFALSLFLSHMRLNLEAHTPRACEVCQCQHSTAPHGQAKSAPHSRKRHWTMQYPRTPKQQKYYPPPPPPQIKTINPQALSQITVSPTAEAAKCGRRTPVKPPRLHSSQIHPNQRTQAGGRAGRKAGGQAGGRTETGIS